MFSLRCCRLLVPAALAGGLTLVACSIEDDYETLSFWFDGVPTPEEMRAAEAAGLEPGDEEPKIVRRRRDPVGLPAGYSRHQPYAEKDCMACHVADLANAGFVLQKPDLRMPRDELCVSCHEPETDTYVHGPSVSGACYVCHAPHHAANPSLLRVAEQRELCVECHTGPFFATEKEHEAYQDQDCAVCHDPHAAAHPSLLREAPE